MPYTAAMGVPRIAAMEAPLLAAVAALPSPPLFKLLVTSLEAPYYCNIEE